MIRGGTAGLCDFFVDELAEVWQPWIPIQQNSGEFSYQAPDSTPLTGPHEMAEQSDADYSSEETGFLHAVAADSSDEVAKLIYADWLDERGDRRGELLRCLVDLSHCESRDDQFHGLRTRLKQLREEADISTWLERIGHQVGTIEAKGDELKRLIVSAPRLLVVQFWAPWSGPCRKMCGLADAFAEQIEGWGLVARINVDEEPECAREYEIASIPTILVFCDGKQRGDRSIGLPRNDDLAAEIELRVAGKG